jgi:alpha-glucosidase
MNREVLSKYDLITVGETPFTHDTKILAEYVQAEAKELQMVFTFEHMDVDGSVASPFIPKKFKLSEFKRLLSKYQEDIPEQGWAWLFLRISAPPDEESLFYVMQRLEL